MNIEQFRERIKRMSRDEKIEEFRGYVKVAGRSYLNLDVDQVMMDQARLGAPDSAIDDALEKMGTLGGRVIGREPLTAQELQQAITARAAELGAAAQARLHPLAPPSFSMRRTGKVRSPGDK